MKKYDVYLVINNFQRRGDVDLRKVMWILKIKKYWKHVWIRDMFDKTNTPGPWERECFLQSDNKVSKKLGVQLEKDKTF